MKNVRSFWATFFESLSSAYREIGSRSYDRYEFYEASVYDVEAMIEEKSREIKDEAVIHTLNEEFVVRLITIFIPMTFCQRRLQISVPLIA